MGGESCPLLTMLPSLQLENAGFLLEGKNELGSGGGDPYMQLAAYYTKSLKGLIGVCKSPSFLMEIYGPNVAISGVVYSDSVCIDKFTTLSLLFQPHDRPAMIKLARTFKALK